MYLVLVGAWAQARGGARALWVVGASLTVGLLIVAVMWPSVTLFYYYGPRASEGMDSLGLPMASVMVFAVLLWSRRLRLRVWARCVIAALLAEIAMGARSFIA